MVGITMKNLLKWKEGMNHSIRKQLNLLELIPLCTVLMVHTVSGDQQVYRSFHINLSYFKRLFTHIDVVLDVHTYVPGLPLQDFTDEGKHIQK